MNYEQRLKTITLIANQLGEIALSRQAENHIDLTCKGALDFASAVDLEIEHRARELITQAFPDENIVGEENGGDAGNDYWIIDPIDGTTNFLRGHPYWAVSIAWVERGEPVVGVIAMPGLGECLSGARGEGIYLNSEGIPAIDGNKEPALMAIGRNGIWPAHERFALENTLESDGYMLMTTGCCAVACAFTILGRLDGYIENYINLWDCAAGVAIGQEVSLEIQYQLDQLQCTEFSIRRA